MAAALGLCACHGPDLISLGGTPALSTERFLSPTGNDSAPGRLDSPWKTFAFAFSKLVPGSTLRLLPGTYEAATTGLLNVRCGEATASSTVPEATQAMNGAPGMPITVRADGDGLAFVHGNGSTPPVSIDGCHDWSIEGLNVESHDLQDHPANPDRGAVVVLDGPNANVTLERLLVRHPNLYTPSDLIRIGDGASHVTVDNCELYDFHANAIEARRSSSLVLLRNYINSRDTADPTGLKVSLDPTRGDYGVILEETSGVYVENNIVEKVSVGFAVVGRGPNVPSSVPTMPIDRNELLGNIVYEPATIGFRIDSRCAKANPCDDAHKVSNTELTNDVVVRGALGVSDAGSVGTKIDKVSVIGAARGVVVSKEPDNAAIPASMTTTSTLVTDFQALGFFAAGFAPWFFAHCDASGGYNPLTNFEPDDAHVMDRVATPPNLGMCLAYIPATSPLRTGALNDVGANVIYKYDDKGQPTTDLLWSPGFVGCRAIVPGVNKDLDTSCGGVNQRLHADTADCPLPPPP